MQEIVLKSEPWLRVSCFALFLTVLMAAERRWPWRGYFGSIKERILFHLGWVAFGTLLIRFIFPMMLIKLAFEIETSNHVTLMSMKEIKTLPVWTHYLLSLLLFDFIMYWQHRITHRVTWLWRMHVMHHSDRTLDVNTGLRFHPIEMLFTTAFKMIAVVFVGVPPLMVLGYEILFNFSTLFAHSNIVISPKWERRIRMVFVTPHMHRVHHSDLKNEQDSNFSIVFSFWDRLLGTYKSFSILGERRMIVGLDEFRDKKHQTLKGMLLSPFFLKEKRKRKIGAKSFRQAG